MYLNIRCLYGALARVHSRCNTPMIMTNIDAETHKPLSFRFARVCCAVGGHGEASDGARAPLYDTGE